MTDRSRLLLLFSVMAGVAVIVAVMSLFVLFDGAYERERNRLMDLAMHQKDMLLQHVGAVGAHGDETHGDGRHAHQTLRAVVLGLGEGHLPSMQMGEASEFLIGWREGDEIAFYVPVARTEVVSRKLAPVPFDSDLAEPMRRALKGETGTVRALDYAGFEVLAAYLPLPGTDIGVVAKIDMAEIRTPFIKAGVITGTGALAIIFLGTILFGRISTPMVKRLESSVRTLANAQRIAHVGDFTRNLETGDIRWSDEMFHIFGVGRKTFRPTFEAILETIHPDDRDSVNDGIARSIADEIPFSAYARIIRPDGEERFVSIVGECVSVESGGPDRFVGTVQDITEWRQAVAALRESEERFRAVIDYAPEAISIKGADGRYVIVNRMYSSWFNAQPEELLGKTIHDLFGAEIADEIAAQDREVTTKGSVVTVEREITHADGTTRYLRVNKFPIFGPGGEGLSIGTIIHDITESKNAEEALRNSEALFRAVVDHSPTKIHIKDVDGRYLLINKEAGKLFGVSDEDGRGKSTHDLFPKEVADAFVAHDRAVMESVVPAQEEEEFTLEDGVHTYLTVKFPIHDGDKVTGVGAIGTDITDQKQAEEAFRRSEERLRGAIESLQEGFALFDADDRLIAANEVYKTINPDATEILERHGTFEELARARVQRGVIVEAIGREEEFIQERLRQHGNMESPIIRHHADGKSYMVHEARTPEGGIAVTFIDVTDLEKTEAQLLQSAKLATLGQMASGIAHELNQPLNIIRMAAESSLIRIEEDAWDTDAHEQKLKQIEDQAERMAEIINHMRVFVREDKGAEDATFPPAASIENALTLLAQQFAASGIDLEKKISGARGLVRGSPVQLEQVVMNLLANARHAVTARIETAAAAGNAFEGRIAVTLEENAENKTITIAVTDNGGGIPPDARAHIFDPFYTTKAEGDGTGLGLSISYKIVEGMGGWLDAVDVEGGTRFEIVLPRAAKQPAPKKRSRKRKKAKAKTKTVSQNNHRILVVDDEALAAEGLAEYLGRKGYDVVTAGDGSEALALFGDRAADVVITDLRMPGMDGYELVRRLREMAPELPILVTTGHTTIGDDEEVVAEGATCVIKKPISLREIMEHLNEVVGHEGRTGI